MLGLALFVDLSHPADEVEEHLHLSGIPVIGPLVSLKLRKDSSLHVLEGGVLFVIHLLRNSPIEKTVEENVLPFLKVVVVPSKPGYGFIAKFLFMGMRLKK